MATKTKSPRIAPVTLDDRESRSGLPAALEAITGKSPQVDRLYVGDILVGEFCIERKEISDFVQSYIEGRLESQLHRLARQTKYRTVILLEGQFSIATLRGLPELELRSVLLDLSLKWRLPVIRSRDVADTARWIHALALRDASGDKLDLAYLPEAREPARKSREGRANTPKKTEAKVSKPEPDPELSEAQIWQKAPPSRIQIAELQRIPGVGHRAAEYLLIRFGTIPAVAKATRDELETVPGIGPTLSFLIHEHYKK